MDEKAAEEDKQRGTAMERFWIQLFRLRRWDLDFVAWCQSMARLVGDGCGRRNAATVVLFFCGEVLVLPFWRPGLESNAHRFHRR